MNNNLDTSHSTPLFNSKQQVFYLKELNSHDHNINKKNIDNYLSFINEILVPYKLYDCDISIYLRKIDDANANANTETSVDYSKKMQVLFNLVLHRIEDLVTTAKQITSDDLIKSIQGYQQALHLLQKKSTTTISYANSFLLENETWISYSDVNRRMHGWIIKFQHFLKKKYARNDLSYLNSLDYSDPQTSVVLLAIVDMIHNRIDKIDNVCLQASGEFINNKLEIFTADYLLSYKEDSKVLEIYSLSKFKESKALSSYYCNGELLTIDTDNLTNNIFFITNTTLGAKINRWNGCNIEDDKAKNKLDIKPDDNEIKIPMLSTILDENTIPLKSSLCHTLVSNGIEDSIISTKSDDNNEAERDSIIWHSINQHATHEFSHYSHLIDKSVEHNYRDGKHSKSNHLPINFTLSNDKYVKKSKNSYASYLLSNNKFTNDKTIIFENKTNKRLIIAVASDNSLEFWYISDKHKNDALYLKLLEEKRNIRLQSAYMHKTTIKEIKLFQQQEYMAVLTVANELTLWQINSNNELYNSVSLLGYTTMPDKITENASNIIFYSGKKLHIISRNNKRTSYKKHNFFFETQINSIVIHPNNNIFFVLLDNGKLMHIFQSISSDWLISLKSTSYKKLLGFDSDSKLIAISNDRKKEY